ncbi:hypothetical protein FJY63_06265, partial [Candidatus Sumerlaeota bacterium]|nr:hypothetical protein [Candidatus Sumerlaeota bacterium]
MADKRTIAGRSPSSCVKAIWVVATLFLPSMGFCSRGQILSASASPTYRGSTVTLYLVVVNSSNFTWGTDLCPAYAITARPSWGLQGTEATGYSWFALGAGNTQSVFWQWGEFGPPDARTDHYLDVTLSAPESPGSCRYVVVDRSRVPLTCAEWPDLVAVGSVVSAYGPVMAGLVGSSLTATIRQTNLGPGPVLFYSWTEVRLSEDENYDFSKDPWLASVLVEP